MSKKNLPWVIMILGATAVGKTDLSIELAERINGEIISVDSRLFYKGMDIGTAKPSIEERERVPHHLIDICDPNEHWSLSKLKVEAQRLISDIQNRGKVPICVGGTGQYINALTQGWVIPKIEENPELRLALNSWAEEIGRVELYRKLQMIDPIAAEKMEPNNLRRTIRAIEVIFSTGRLFSEQRKKEDLPYRVYQVGLQRDRSEIFERLEKRVDLMMQQGFLQEVEQLLAKGYSRDTRAFSAIGYSQLISYLSNEIDLDVAIDDIKRQTKKFVRRQNTWFKQTDPEINWYQMNQNPLESIISDLINLKILPKS
jgi:tRNA dimethylallyltransferase